LLRVGLSSGQQSSLKRTQRTKENKREKNRVDQIEGNKKIRANQAKARKKMTRASWRRKTE
jgi:hypothetical protein